MDQLREVVKELCAEFIAEKEYNEAIESLEAEISHNLSFIEEQRRWIIDLTSQLKEQNEKISTLKKTVDSQEKELVQLKQTDRYITSKVIELEEQANKGSLVIKGVPESIREKDGNTMETGKNALNFICSKLNIANESTNPNNIIHAYRYGKFEKGRQRLVKIKLEQHISNKILSSYAKKGAEQSPNRLPYHMWQYKSSVKRDKELELKEELKEATSDGETYKWKGLSLMVGNRVIYSFDASKTNTTQTNITNTQPQSAPNTSKYVSRYDFDNESL